MFCISSYVILVVVYPVWDEGLFRMFPINTVLSFPILVVVVGPSCFKSPCYYMNNITYLVAILEQPHLSDLTCCHTKFCHICYGGVLVRQ